MTAAAANAPSRHEFVLYPNSSLPTRGFVAIMAAVAAVSFSLGVAFAALGAWPVTGFLGLDAVGLYLAFRAVRRDSRRFEVIRIDAEACVVRQLRPGGAAAEVRFEPYWTRVRLERPEGGIGHGRLFLASGSRWVEVGRFLTAEEKAGLARALEVALAAHR